MSRVLLVALLVALAACAAPSDPPLSVIHGDDPTWHLTPDHLEYGTLPK
jgi:hypothetical protein